MCGLGYRVYTVVVEESFAEAATVVVPTVKSPSPSEPVELPVPV